MDEKPRMKKISPFQTHYLQKLRKIKSSSPEEVLEKANSIAEELLQKYKDEEGIQEAIGKLWAQTMGVFEKKIPEDPKKSADQIREIAKSASTFLIDKFGPEGGPLIKDVYKVAITQFILLLNDKELAMRIAKRIALDGAEMVRKIELEDVAKDILKIPFIKVKPRSSMF